MSSFLNAVRADLLDRRTRVVLIALLAALIAGLAYALTGGSGSSPSPASSSVPPAASGARGIAAVAAPPNPAQAVAETTSGSAQQRGGSIRDPFTALPGTVAKTASAGKTSATSSTKAVASSSSTSTSTSSATHATVTTRTTATAPSSSGKPSTPAKPKTTYHVAVLFGVIPTGTAPVNAQLTPHQNLKSGQRLPTPTKALLTFAGVARGGKRAAFKLDAEALLRGSAVCVPSPTHCKQIELGAGQSEELETMPAGAPPVVYELQVASITSGKATAAAVHQMRVYISHGVAVAEPVATGAALWLAHAP